MAVEWWCIHCVSSVFKQACPDWQAMLMQVSLCGYCWHLCEIEPTRDTSPCLTLGPLVSQYNQNTPHDTFSLLLGWFYIEVQSFYWRYSWQKAQLTSEGTFHGIKAICLDLVLSMQYTGYVLSVVLNCSLNCVFKQDLSCALYLMCAIKNAFALCTHFNMLEAKMEAFNPNNNVWRKVCDSIIHCWVTEIFF